MKHINNLINLIIKLHHILIFCFILFFFFQINISNFSNTIKVEAAQKGFYYKLPFRADENWGTDGDYGIHADSTGLSIDFYSYGSFKNEILSPADGYLTKGCSVNGATSLLLTTTSGDKFRFVHLFEYSVPVASGQTLFVRQGEIIGKVTGVGNFERAGCVMSSDGPHVHFSWTTDMCNPIIQGFTFDCSGLFNCAGIGVYNVSCNRKYLNTRFFSTNKPPFQRANCYSRIINFSDISNPSAVLELQKCLISINLLDSQYQTGFYGSLTQNALFYGRKMLTMNANCQQRLNDNYYIGETNIDVYNLQTCLSRIGFMSERLTTSYFGDITNNALKLAKQALDVTRN